MKGSDLSLELPITLLDVLNGTEKTISIGHGGFGNKVSVKVPRGIETGKKLRVTGKGSPSPAGGPPGDLYLLIKVQPHPLFTREGHDLVVDKQIPFSAAVLGTEISVPTLEGKQLKVRVPDGTQPQSKLRIKEHGLPCGPKGGRGSLYVRISVQLPKTLTEKQKALVRELADEGL